MRLLRRSVPEAVQRRTPGWATCSAPGARAYELTFGRALGGLYLELGRDLRALAGQDDPRHILDVGAGPGGLAVALAAQFPSARITTADVDPAMSARAVARVRGEGLADHVEVVVADVAALPMPDACLDLVTSSFSVHHWPDAPGGFAEIRRVLRPGGRAIIYDLPDWWGRFETAAGPLAQAAGAGGFTDVHVTTLRWPGPMRVVQRLEADR